MVFCNGFWRTSWVLALSVHIELFWETTFCSTALFVNFTNANRSSINNINFLHFFQGNQIYVVLILLWQIQFKFNRLMQNWQWCNITLFANLLRIAFSLHKMILAWNIVFHSLTFGYPVGKNVFKIKVKNPIACKQSRKHPIIVNGLIPIVLSRFSLSFHACWISKGLRYKIHRILKNIPPNADALEKNM